MCLSHIFTAINHIQEFIGDMDFNAYEADLKTRSAVERQLQIVTEAAFRLGEDAEKLCPGVEWPEARGFGNRLRHEYDRIEDRKVWDTVHGNLLSLKIVVSAALQKLTSSHNEPR